MENEKNKEMQAVEHPAEELDLDAIVAEVLGSDVPAAELDADTIVPEAPAEEATPAETDLDAIVAETMAAIDAAEELPDIETNLDKDAEFQEALEALKAFSARYDSSSQAPAEAPVQEAPVSQDTMPFTTPVVPPVETQEPTQKFAPVVQEEEAPAPAEAAPQEEQMPVRKGRPPVRKTRPQHKKGYGLFGLPHLVSTGIWLAIIVTIGISLGRIAWVCAADLLAFGKADKEISITIAETDDLKAISEKLASAGLVRYPNLFYQFAKITGKGEKINPGTYNLNSKYDYNALLKIMAYVDTRKPVIEVLVPEGYNCAQIFKLLEEKGVCTAADLEEWAANGELNEYWFLEGVTRGSKYCLEGYLYPDTYFFYENDEPARVLGKFLNNFKKRFTEKMYNDFLTMQKRFDTMLKENGYGKTYREKHKLTFHKLITLASIVEEEKATAAEGYNIAAVFYNRLAKPGSFPRLDSDATVYYAIGAYLEKKPLTAKDLASTSPYNTRLAGGLPPGPITNPGSYSLYASLYANQTRYYYFIFDKAAGIHRFSQTLEEHNEWAEKLGLQ